MPAKSRKNRRNIPQNRSFKAPPAKVDQTSAAPVASSPVARIPGSTSSMSSGRPAPFAAVTYPHIMSELKWIGLVTVTVAVILALVYIYLPK
jgi:hypothetical protein